MYRVCAPTTTSGAKALTERYLPPPFAWPHPFDPRQMPMRFRFFPLLALVSLGCAGAPPAPPPVPEPAEPPFTFGYSVVWSARPEVAIVVDSVSARAVRRPFTRLEVLSADPDGLTVRCATCGEGGVEGRIAWEDVIFEPDTPISAAHGTISEFALAVRAAAERQDVEALRLVMARDFTYALIGQQGREVALVAWEAERWATLENVPRLLDRGLSTRDSMLWAAPGEHLETLGYRGYRLGFRGTPDGRWEWTFLMRDDR
jgi:hypothetical protein